MDEANAYCSIRYKINACTDTCFPIRMGKFLGTAGAWSNGASFSHIHG